MSVRMYLVNTSAAFLPDGPAYPANRPVRAADLYGSMIGSSFHSLCFSQSVVGPTEKPFCVVNHLSKTGLELIQRRNSLAPFWFFE